MSVLAMLALLPLNARPLSKHPLSVQLQLALHAQAVLNAKLISETVSPFVRLALANAKLAAQTPNVLVHTQLLPFVTMDNV